MQFTISNLVIYKFIQKLNFKLFFFLLYIILLYLEFYCLFYICNPIYSLIHGFSSKKSLF